MQVKDPNTVVTLTILGCLTILSSASPSCLLSGNTVADTIVEMQVPADLAPGKPNDDELLATDVVMSLEDNWKLQRCKGFVVESVCKGLKGPRYEYILTMKSQIEERILTGSAGQKRYEQLEVQVQLLNRTPLGGKCITVTSKLPWITLHYLYLTVFCCCRGT